MESSITELKRELNGRANIVVINADHPENAEFVNDVGINVVPTIVFFDKDFNKVNTIVGYKTKDELHKEFKKIGVK